MIVIKQTALPKTACSSGPSCRLNIITLCHCMSSGFRLGLCMKSTISEAMSHCPSRGWTSQVSQMTKGPCRRVSLLSCNPQYSSSHGNCHLLPTRSGLVLDTFCFSLCLAMMPWTVHTGISMASLIRGEVISVLCIPINYHRWAMVVWVDMVLINWSRYAKFGLLIWGFKCTDVGQVKLCCHGWLHLHNIKTLKLIKH